MMFSVLVSSPWSCRKFWFALRSGYASATAISRPSACVSPLSAATRSGMLGAATARARAAITASSASRSCEA
jgi:hypothetical protein